MTSLDLDCMFVEALDKRNLNKIKSLVDEWNYQLPIDKIEKMKLPATRWQPECQCWIIFYTYYGKPTHTTLNSSFIKSVELAKYLIKELRKQKIKALGN